MRTKYLGLKDGCFNHGIWVHDRIHVNEAEIEIAFLGSSHTINGINDKLISNDSILGEATNLGYCTYGRNLHLTLLKQLFQHKKPKYVVLEVRESEDWYSHGTFPLVGTKSEIFNPVLFFNRDILIDIFDHYLYNLELFQDQLFGTEPVGEVDPRLYGHACSETAADTATLAKYFVKRNVIKPKRSEIENWYHNRYPLQYLEKILSLCTENNCEVLFLYIPQYGSPYGVTELRSTYEALGNLMIPPKSIFENLSHWHDVNHLNLLGANELSEWVRKELQKRYSEEIIR